MFSGGGGFSTGQPQQPTTFGFPTAGQPAPPNASPFTFGSPAAAVPGGVGATPVFGSGTATGGGTFSGFGAQIQPPAAPQTGFSGFGTTPTFGMGRTTTTGFGGGGQFGATQQAPTTAPTLGMGGFGGFGQPAAPTLGGTTGLGGFGSQQPVAVSTASPFSFGTPTAAVAPTVGGGFGGFGTPAQPAQQTGLSFGQTPTAAVATAPTGGVSFGVAAPATTTSAFSFGAPATTTTAAAAPTTFGFGVPTSVTGTTQPVAAAAPFSFGLPTSAPTTTTTGSVPSFGASPWTATSTTTVTAASTGFSFAAPSTTTSASTGLTLNLTPQPSAFSFGSTAPASTSAFGFNLGGTTVSSTATQPTASTSTTFTGLGGVQASGVGGLSGTGLAGSSAKPEGRAILDLPVPPEILQIVEELKTYMKSQKVKMSEICRVTDKNIDKVTEEVEDTRLAVSNITNQVHRQVLFCNALMKDIQEEMKNLDMAMVTRDTPLALQNEITAPTSYFFNLVSNYHERMITYKREIERAEIALTSLAQSSAFSPKDLVLGLKGTKDTVIALAAKVQDLHEQVVNEMAVDRNLKRFPMEGDGGHSGRSGTFLPGHSEPLASTYDQAYHKLNDLFSTPQRSGGGESFYRPTSSTSTPLINPNFTSPQPLFQTASSTILGSPGALKRPKH